MHTDDEDHLGEVQDFARIVTKLGRQVDLRQYFREYPDELMRGVLVTGAIGSGKTQRALSVARSALETDHAVLVFDPSNDYQRLLQVHPDGIVIDFKEFILNPLEPPGSMTQREWNPIFIQIFSQNFGLKDPSISILQKALKRLTSDGDQDIQFTLSDLLEEVRAYHPRPRSSESSSHASVMNRLESVLDSEWGRCLDVKHGFSPQDIQTGLLIIQLRPIGIERVHELVVAFTLAKLYAHRSWLMVYGERPQRKVLVVVEEAHRFLSEMRQSDRYGQRSFLERALVESRKLGIGFVIVDQMPHRISSYVLGSCSAWIVCKLMDAESRKMVADALCMEQVWSRNGIMDLPTGCALVRVGNMAALEEMSPLENSSGSVIDDVGTRYLPVILAVPKTSDAILQDDDTDPFSLTAQNPRYLCFFERYLKQQYELLRHEFDESERVLLQSGFDSLLNAPLINTSTEPNQDGESEDFHSETTLDVYDIDSLKTAVSCFSNRTALQVLSSLKTQPVNLLQLAAIVGKSYSQMSRVVQELQKAGMVRCTGRGRHTSGTYTLTRAGATRFRKAVTIRDPDRRPNEVEIGRDELEELLQRIESVLSIIRRSTIAGIRGNENISSEATNLYYLGHYFLEQDRERPEDSDTTVDMKTFRVLRRCLGNDVLSTLLLRKRPVTLQRIEKETSLCSRTVRRSLELLEQQGVVRRIWHNGLRGALVVGAWRTMLYSLSDGREHTIHVPARYIRRVTDFLMRFDLIRRLVR